MGLVIGPIGALGIIKEMVVGREAPAASGNGAGAWGRFAGDMFGLAWLIGSALATLVLIPFFGLWAFALGPAAICALGGLFMAAAGLRA